MARLGGWLAVGGRTVRVLAVAACFAASSAEAAGDRAAVGPQVTAKVVEDLREGVGLPPEAELLRAPLLAFYKRGQRPLLWIGSSRLPALIEVVAGAGSEGLNPADYPIPTPPSDDASVADLARAEIAFSALFLRYASDLKVGRTNPRKVDPELFAQTKVIDVVATLIELAEAEGLTEFHAQWAPQNPEYRALKRLLSEHREIAARGGWPMVADGETLERDSRHPRVGELRARLEGSQDITVKSLDPQFFDEALVMAVKRFQKRHGLSQDGVVGKNTLASLNVSVAARIDQIMVNMERWRWLPEDLGAHYVLVNIAGFELKAVENGAVTERMPVVVGKPYRRTPVFSDRIRYIEFNPDWTVPQSIAVKDELPKIKKDRNFLKKNGFEVLLNGKRVAPETIQWSSLSASRFPYTLRQKPGPENALGRMKFMFPNRFSVYLHDSPAKSLFERATRAFSSGCIRVARPKDLAEVLLRDVPGWSLERINVVLQKGETTRVDLAEPWPVHLTYSTAWSGEGGTIHFRRDIYGRDEKLREALFRN